MNAERIAALVGSIYDAALAGDWRPPLTALGRMSGSHHVVLMDDRARDQLLVASGSPVIEAAYADQYAPLNDAWPPLATYSLGVPVLERTVLDMERYVAGIFFNEFARPNGLVASTGCVIARDPGGATTAIVLNHPERTVDQERSDLALLALLGPHFRRGLQLHALHGAAAVPEADAAIARPQPNVAAVMVDDRGVVITANAAGQEFVSAGRAIFASPAAAAPGAVHSDILPALPAACSPSPERRALAHKVIGAHSEGGRYGVTVLPLQGPPAWAGTTRSCYLVMLTDAEARTRSRRDLLTTRYGLTRAEAELVLLLGDAATLADIAAGLGVRLSTAKTLLSRAMDKTDLHSQAQLVRMAERLPA